MFSMSRYVSGVDYILHTFSCVFVVAPAFPDILFYEPAGFVTFFAGGRSGFSRGVGGWVVSLPQMVNCPANLPADN